MIGTGFESRVKVQQIVQNQLPEFILDESPNAVEFLKQYYISQEYQGGPVDIAENLDQYLKLDNLTSEVIVGNVGLTTNIDSNAGIITVTSTKGFPQRYGLIKINDEIITYTGITTNTFTGCIRGFSGVTNYHQDLNSEELVFSESEKASHSANTSVENLSSLFLREFYKKLKSALTPGLENTDFVSDLNVGNFIKNARSFYQSKGTDESFRILFNVLYGVTPKVVNLEDYLIKPSSAEFIRREVLVAERISGDPTRLVGQTIKKSNETVNITSASVSEVETFTRKNIQYFKISLFVGYNEFSAVEGNFTITPNTKCLEDTEIGSSVITVDSTISFPESGTLFSGNNIISYTSKSINQFFGCTGIKYKISLSNNIRSDELYYGYEDGDITKKVELRLTGVLSKFKQISETLKVSEGDEIFVKNLGEVVRNPSQNKSYKEIFANSWIYNTSSRYQISSINGSAFVLSSKIDRSSLKLGDRIEIIQRGTNNILSDPLNLPYISIIVSDTQINLNNLSGFIPVVGQEYDLRRKINKASSSIVPIEFGNNVLLSDIQNVYNENDEYMYVASNSLPSNNSGLSIPYAYQITKNINTVNASGLSDQISDGKYSTLLFNNSVSFINGDLIYYASPENSTLGLETGSYYVEVLSPGNKVKLYGSKAFVGTDQYLTFTSTNFTLQTHTFTLYSQRSSKISAQKLLRKYPLNSNIQNGVGEVTIPGSIGMLINGVEVKNYKSDDKIYYGPLQSINVLNGGNDYDVVNPPLVSISPGEGVNALVQPVVSGSIKKVYVDSQEFDINNIISINVTGGNGKGVTLEPIIKKRVREVYFDARTTEGINIAYETIQFLTNHNFTSGDPIIYNSNGNLPLGIGSYGGSNLNQNITLTNNATYYAKVDNNSTIRLYPNFSDYSSGINTIGFTGINASGIHKFTTVSNKKTLSELKVINGGSDYTNRKLIVTPTGISTINHTINFNNHGFNDGELISYDYQTSNITGISTTNQYYILKFDNDSFRLCDAGIGGTDGTNYIGKNYIKFTSTGSGYQYFNYPKILISIQYSPVGVNTEVRTITATPVVKGSIIDTYLYEGGTGYGSTILNLHRKPLVKIKTGKESQITPSIINGSIVSVNINYGGYEYYSIPDLIVEDFSGSGSGADLRAIVTNNKITSVSIINPGIGYSSSSTSVKVVPSGSNAILDSNVRSLRVNNNTKFGDELLNESDNNLQYSICGYYDTLRLSLNDDGAQHSPIIGWAYDGNPIYGAYGYTNPEDPNTQQKVLTPGYQLNTSNIIDRPLQFADGFFVEDYQYTNSGDLDTNNGRFGKTPEFPNGVYAYFATIEKETLKSKFPYFVGNTYRSNAIKENFSLDQTYDFNNSNLLRNTFPYKVSEIYANNDFIIESNEILNQKTIIESVTDGYVSSIDILNSGYDYKVNDVLEFDDTGTGGGGLIAKVSSIEGKDIVSLNTSVETYNNSIFTWKYDNTVKVSILPNHNLSNNDYVIISGFSTSLSELNGSYQIGITSYYSNVLKTIPASTAGLTTEIYLSQLPPQIVSVGSSIGIGTETLSVLEVFKNMNILKVQRGLTGVSHTATSQINFIPNSFTISKNIDYFESKLNDKVYFNPTESIGIGTQIGITSSITFQFGDSNTTRIIPTQGIYIENHPFVTNQQIIFRKPNGSTDNISVSTSPTGIQFNIPSTGDYQILYVVNKSKNTIGLKTSTNSSELFFVDLNGVNNDDKYSLESTYSQITGKIERIKSTVSVSTSHELLNGDNILLKVEPNLSVGIGTSTSVYVKRNTINGNILINPIGFNSTGINTTTSIITINSHNLNTGDKVSYSADLVASGLSTDSYYVHKINDNQIKLSVTYLDCKNDPPITVSIASTGGKTQFISLITPQIKSIKNNNLVFNLSDSSLSGYKFKVYYDKEFKNEFVSTATTTGFTLSGVGTIGISPTASLTINYDPSLPTKLYYNLEKNGYISTSDIAVNNYSEILFTNSLYDSNFNYKIFGVGSTTFSFSLDNIPEKLSYLQNECDTLEYSTNSLSAKGPINKINIVSGGTDYKKLPVFKGSNSTDGKDAYLIPKSNIIGNIREVRITNEGFEYSSDKTLQPFAYISPLITIENSDTIGIVTVTNGGTNYISAPSIVIVDTITGKKIDSGVLVAKLSNNSISSVDIVKNPKGLPSTTVKLSSTNNNNGISIQSVESSSTGIFTCYITTPLLGYSVAPFSVGDKVFVEGITKSGTNGTGFNSEDYGYEFLTVSGYQATNPDKVIFNISNLTSNTGIANEIQDSFATIVNSKNYPTFKITQIPSYFLIGEKIISNNIERDLIITDSTETFIKVFGSYELSLDEVIKGKQSGSIATIKKIETNTGLFEINYSSEKSIGWTNDTGKLNYDNQSMPDNDYYQNLSYTVKSSIQYEDLKTPVNSLLHTSGLKNFSDTGITSTASSELSGNTVDSLIVDIINEKRVDTVYNFDLVKDVDVLENSSKTLKLKNITLTPYINCDNNIVLGIDNINHQFSNLETEPSEFLNILQLGSNDSYANLIFRISNLDNSQIQFTELVVLNNTIDTFLLNKSSVSNTGEEFGEFSIFTDQFNDSYLRFNPTNPYDIDYDLKSIKTIFNTILPGIGTQSIGFVDLTGLNIGVQSGITTSIISAQTSKLKSLYADIQVIDAITNEMTFVELYLAHDGTNTYISEYYVDSESETGNYSGNFIGSFSSTISSGILSLKFNNTSTHQVKLRSKIVGFGSTAVGVGTYRFKKIGQLAGNERSVKYESQYKSNVSTASTDIISLNKNNFNALKSLVKVSVGSTISLHQVSLIQDTNNIFVEQSAFLSVGSTVGIGSFGGEYSGSDFVLKFYKSSEVPGSVEISSFNQCIYTAIDDINIPPDLIYGSLTDSVQVNSYNALNGDRINRTAFNMTTNDGYPIFAQTFDPTDANPDTLVVELSTGLFKIDNHFFSNGEKLIYTPKSSFIGVPASALMVGGSPLPSEVYAIRESSDTFKLALTKNDALSANNVVFSSSGSGNAHQLEMSKKNEKALITLDNIVQYPLIRTPIAHTLSGNGGGISIASSIFALSGISTIVPKDILKIDNEYMKIENVGLGTTNTGPITNIGSIPLVKVSRGFVGSSASTHTDSAVARIYKGSFNIVDNKIHFAEAPRGNPQITFDTGNLPFQTSDFNGRVFLRGDYDTNAVYDDISNQFTGIGRTFTLTIGGTNTVGLGSTGGNGILFVNNVFQTPTTDNNPNNNFKIIEDSVSGITSVVFSGIQDPQTKNIITSKYDVNQNQTPRGGIIISLGSSAGLGYEPLVGASVTARVGAGGSIVSIGIGTTTGTFGSGYNGIVAIGVSVYESGHIGSAATITASVGAGGTLSFSIGYGGTGYSNPKIFVSEPSYEDLEVIGVSRLGIGATTSTGIGLLMNVVVGASSTTGIGSTYFEVTGFNITRQGYSFQRGDVFKPVGLVTDRRLVSPLSQFTLTVLDTFTDSFAAWQFGELDYIDSVKKYQNGSRQRFPLFYNGNLLSFEKNDDSDPLLELDKCLLIFVNGIIQESGLAYEFEGGTSFKFTTAPKPEDNVAIFFYRGTKGEGGDSSLVTNVNQSLKEGDTVQVLKNNSISGTITQDERTITNLRFSDKFETDLYSGQGVDANNYKPLSWLKQKVDKTVNGQIVYKSRDSIESQVYPTANIIRSFSSTDTEIFVDDVQLFDFDLDMQTNGDTFDALIVDGKSDPVSAGLRATVSSQGIISELTITNVGSGYTGTSLTVKIARPPFIGVGIGSTATAMVSISNGGISSPVIVSSGYGYSISNPPQVIVPLPKTNDELISRVNQINGFSGIITGITTTTGTLGNPLAIKFFLKSNTGSFTGLTTGYPIYIFDTCIGTGVTSIDNSNSSVVGIGSSFLDNIYKIHEFNPFVSNATIICNIHSSSSIVGIATTGSISNPVGKFSWGRMSGFARSGSPISIGVSGNTITSGLSTFATIQRRGVGLRQTGSLVKGNII
jgi:hypothetical protein